MRKGTYDVSYRRDGVETTKVTVQAEDDFAAEKAVRARLAAEHPEIDEWDWEIDEPEAVRPSEEDACQAIYDFLCEEMGQEAVDESSFEMHPDGSGWQFWVREEDTTSYVHHNLGIEWYGTGWKLGDGDPRDSNSAGY